MEDMTLEQKIEVAAEQIENSLEICAKDERKQIRLILTHFAKDLVNGASTSKDKALNLACVSGSLPLTYETLPNKIKEMMFEKHEHAELLDPEEICYKESDVINIINAILGNDC